VSHHKRKRAYAPLPRETLERLTAHLPAPQRARYLGPPADANGRPLAFACPATARYHAPTDAQDARRTPPAPARLPVRPNGRTRKPAPVSPYSAVTMGSREDGAWQI